MREQNERQRAELEQLLDGVQGQLEALTLSDTQRELLAIQRAFEETTSAARDRGASETDLAAIYKLAGLQVQQVIQGLQGEIAALTDQLYGGEIHDAILEEKQRLAELDQAREDSYRAELSRHNAVLASNAAITQFLNGLMLGNLSTLSPEQRLAEAQRQFDTALTSGDGGQATQAFQSLLEIARHHYSDTQAYRDIFTSGNQALQALITSPGATPTAPGSTSTSSTLAALESQLASQQAQQAAAQRQALVEDLIQAYTDYGMATDTSVLALMDANGLNLQQLAADFGLSLADLDAGQTTRFAELAAALGTDTQTLAAALGADLESLGINMTDLNDEVAALASSNDAGTVHLYNLSESLIPALAYSLGLLFNQAQTHHDALMGRLNSVLSVMREQRDLLSDWRSSYNQYEWLQAARDERVIDELEDIDRTLEHEAIKVYA